MSSRKKYFIAFLIALIVGFNIYHRSSPPPYGDPLNELSDNYWGVITDIAHRWRAFDVSWWNREIGGGMSLFTSGEYPIINPTNALAWVLNDDQFFLVKLIEPYVLGLFFMMILLWDVFKTRWYIALFGGLAYMGLILSRQTTIAESPYFLYGCGIFPGMIFVFLKLNARHIYLAAAGAGVFMALQFLGEGVTQLPQLFIWWMILLTVYFFGIKEHWIVLVKKWFVTVFIFLSSSIGLAAAQLVPSMHFFKYEAARGAGYNLINSFPIFSYPGEPHSLMKILSTGLLGPSPAREKIFSVLILICLALSVAHFGRIFEKTRERKFIYLMWVATIGYFLLGPSASLLVEIVPFFKKIFNVLTLFHFRYGLHILDFCVILSLCLILNDDELSLRTNVFVKKPFILKGLTFLVLISALLMGFLPLYYLLWPSGLFASSWQPYFAADNLNKAVGIAVQTLVLIFLMAYRPKNPLRHVALVYILIGFSFMMTLTCFKWYDKGCRTAPEKYQLNSPEGEYYRRAKGKYIMPYSAFEPEWILHNYNMLYGVHGTSGFMALAPKRVVEFACYYNKQCRENAAKLPGAAAAYFITIEKMIPSSFTTYFPIDFTLVKKDINLNWQDFSKVVSGDEYHVYERTSPTPRVYFANNLKVVSLPQLTDEFDRPRSEAVYVAVDDAKALKIHDEKLDVDINKTHYQEFIQNKANGLSFQTSTDHDVFVVVPEMYAKGWRVLIDGKNTPIFPAHYLFIGFRMPDGVHQVELNYQPPWLWPGGIMNILSILGVILLFRKYKLLPNS